MLLVSHRLLARLLVAALVIPPAFTRSTFAQDHEPIPVELWRNGDDGLTIKFSETIEATFAASKDFVMSSGKKGTATVIVTIPTNVRWKRIGNRNEIFYTVQMTRGSSAQKDVETGSCWEIEI